MTDNGSMNVQIGPDGSKGPIREGIGCLLQALALAIIVLSFYVGQAIVEGKIQL